MGSPAKPAHRVGQTIQHRPELTGSTSSPVAAPVASSRPKAFPDRSAPPDYSDPFAAPSRTIDMPSANRAAYTAQPNTTHPFQSSPSDWHSPPAASTCAARDRNSAAHPCRKDTSAPRRWNRPAAQQPVSARPTPKACAWPEPSSAGRLWLDLLSLDLASVDPQRRCRLDSRPHSEPPPKVPGMLLPLKNPAEAG